MIDLTRMFSDRPGTPGPQAADAADDQVDLHAGLAGRVEPVDHCRIDQRVQLGPDRRRPARAGVGDLGVDQLDEAVAQVERRDRRSAPAPRGST